MKVDHERALRAAQGFGTGFAVADDDTVRLVFEAYVDLRDRHAFQMGMLRDRIRRAMEHGAKHGARHIDDASIDKIIEAFT